MGTYAEAWKTNSLTSRFLYVGGVQISLFKNILNIYMPIIYSSDFRDQLKTIPAAKYILEKNYVQHRCAKFRLQKNSSEIFPFVNER